MATQKNGENNTEKPIWWLKSTLDISPVVPRKSRDQSPKWT